MKRILFICMGNICRSPTVEAIARVEFARAGLAVEVASAGTEDYHVGRGADARSIAVAAAHGYSLAAHRARQVCSADFARFDHLLVMDRTNLRALQRFHPDGPAVQPALFLDEEELPDPYYGEHADFERVIVLARHGTQRWIERLRGTPGVR
ncbi:low molecular weight protein-tyrosine-phosphatase [Dokdonella sp.]|uniref:low molecular weight protein-tyrosine-phosphatase n=1 Tax=Dokdonella sp. TaxID=2291710 RepID=UPI0031C6D843|nr:low molecular weight phosphotyrosine protein phosphatase [Dokdonella sp.]